MEHPGEWVRVFSLEEESMPLPAPAGKAALRVSKYRR
jgi:hypothetical protein